MKILFSTESFSEGIENSIKKRQQNTLPKKFNLIFKGKAVRKCLKEKLYKVKQKQKAKSLKKEKSINEAKTEIVIVLNDKLNETLEDLESQDSTDGITDSIK